MPIINRNSQIQDKEIREVSTNESEKLSPIGKYKRYKKEQKLKFLEKKMYFSSNDDKTDEQEKRNSIFIRKLYGIAVVLAILVILYKFVLN